MERLLVAYRRVSTVKQGVSGLGLEAQDAAISSYALSVRGKIIKSYTEIETGKRSDRPELAKALADCKRNKAMLVIAKLDRLSRNVHFLSGLMESKVEFICCDMPSANRLTLHIMAAVAEDEARRISDRTKAALAAYKARGGVLGSARVGAYRLKGGANVRGAAMAGETSRRLAIEAYVDVMPVIAGLTESGMSPRKIAASLMNDGYKSRRGKEWNHIQVMRVLRMITP